ncbi:ABC transporter ATP-binding protein [Gordonia sp. PDNC005]|uniref:ABC transporter ATP-binding protein n=1 Tax=unclassified Gordonia (in: high G+C Gram-positive bacteria) TaxID=2657482 RepID=UPI001965ACDD|nr:ABC transporter ATP-binding protein [Gordonia sp. PDNC005]QRY61972.1 ABC transporter ATP-binding protein [Gordonia sp. PDNC005]
MNTVLPVATPRAVGAAVARLLAPQRSVLVATAVLMVAGSAAALAVPPLLGVVVDAVAGGHGLAHVWWACAGLLLSGVVAAALSWYGGLLLIRCLQRSLSGLREEAFARAVASDLGSLEVAGSSDAVSRVTTDVESVTEAVTGVVPRMLGAALTIGLTGVGLVALDPWLALAALPAIPVQLLATWIFLRRSRPLYSRLRVEEAIQGQSIIESVRGVETVRAHRLQDKRLAGLAAASHATIETQCEASRARNRFNGGLNIAEYIALAGVLAVGFHQVTAGALTIGAVTAGALFIHRLFGPVGGLLGGIDELQRALAGLERIVGLVDSDLGGRSGGQEVADASVCLKSVSFTYRTGAHTAVSDVDMVVPSGATAVLVGASGSGKSTTARLIAGLAEPSSGVVQVGGVPADRATSNGRPAVLLVTQETHAFTGTVADNLRLAAPDASNDDLAEAAAAVGVEHAPEVLDQQLSDAAVTDDALVQRLALARVLLADPPVVVLDEATAQDGGTGLLDAALARVAAGRTAIVVAHRLSQTVDADVVAVFDEGRLTESGTAHELRQLDDGAFAELWKAWSRV